LGISDVIGEVSDLGGATSDTDDDDLDPTSQSVVYDDVDNAELFTIDPDTGDKEVLDPSEVSDSAQIEVVDDDPDADDDLDSLDVDGPGFGDPQFAVDADDLVDDDADDFEDV
jgi:hypothetical protein